MKITKSPEPSCCPSIPPGFKDSRRRGDDLSRIISPKIQNELFSTFFSNGL